MFDLFKKFNHINEDSEKFSLHVFFGYLFVDLLFFIICLSYFLFPLICVFFFFNIPSFFLLPLWERLLLFFLFIGFYSLWCRDFF